MNKLPADPFRKADGSLFDVLLEGELGAEQVAKILADPDAGWPAAFRAVDALGDDQRRSTVLFAGLARMIDERERQERERRNRERWVRQSRYGRSRRGRRR